MPPARDRTSSGARPVVQPYMKKKLVMVLAWLAVASLTVAPAYARDRSERVDIAATAARLDALHVRISGDRRDLQAAELVNYHRVEGGIAACMRAAGKTYRVKPFASHYDGFT